VDWTDVIFYCGTSSPSEIISLRNRQTFSDPLWHLSTSKEQAARAEFCDVTKLTSRIPNFHCSLLKVEFPFVEATYPGKPLSRWRTICPGRTDQFWSVRVFIPSQPTQVWTIIGGGDWYSTILQLWTVLNIKDTHDILLFNIYFNQHFFRKVFVSINHLSARF
jgi:hypothetical protein